MHQLKLKAFNTSFLNILFINNLTFFLVTNTLRLFWLHNPCQCQFHQELKCVIHRSHSKCRNLMGVDSELNADFLRWKTRLINLCSSLLYHVTDTQTQPFTWVKKVLISMYKCWSHIFLGSHRRNVSSFQFVRHHISVKWDSIAFIS